MLPECDEDHVTSEELSDLFSPASGVAADIPESLAKLHVHGVTIFEGAMGAATAAELRDHIVERNANAGPLSRYYVHEPGFRTHLMLGMDDHPIVKKAVQEVLSNNVLQAVLKRALGTDPSLVEHAAITSQPGAPAQFWHRDTEARKEDAPLITLFMPLQNTTAGMGSTGLCPGTHACTGHGHHCADRPTIEAEVAAGDVVAMNSRTIHRGGPHTGYWEEDRVLYYMSFTRPPQRKVTLPEGSTYCLRWDQWGYTYDELVSGRFGKFFTRSWRMWDYWGQEIEEKQRDHDDFHPNQDDIFNLGLGSLLLAAVLFFLPGRLQGMKQAMDGMRGAAGKSSIKAD
ncbi:unnamed protein product [Chrysoparadoxa australica]